MKAVNLFILACVVAIMTSCYSTKIYHGTAVKAEPVIEVNKTWNHHFLYGLISISKGEKAENYVGQKKGYMVETRTTFVNGLISMITYGIYTPTSTYYYVPLREIQN